MSCSVLNRRRNYMRNPFPMETGFYGLVRNTGCLDKSNLSCSICICIRRQRAPSLMPGTHRTVECLLKFACLRIRSSRHPFPLPPHISPHLFISLSASACPSALTESPPRPPISIFLSFYLTFPLISAKPFIPKSTLSPFACDSLSRSRSVRCAKSSRRAPLGTPRCRLSSVRGKRCARYELVTRTEDLTDRRQNLISQDDEG